MRAAVQGWSQDVKACASVPRVLGGLRLCIPSPRRGVDINSDMTVTAGGGGYHLRSRGSQYAVSMKDRDRQYSRRPLSVACWVPGTVAARGTHRRWLRTIEQRSVRRHGSEARAAITRYKVGLTTLSVYEHGAAQGLALLNLTSTYIALPLMLWNEPPVPPRVLLRLGAGRAA